MSLKNSRGGKDLSVIPLDLGVEPEANWGGILARSQGYISASPEGPYAPQQKAQISLPLEMCDFRNSTLQFTLTGTAGAGGTFTRFENGIKSIIDRITIQFGSKVVLDIQDYNVLSYVDDLTQDINWFPTVGKYMFGYGTTGERDAWFLLPNKVYAVQLYRNHDDFLHSVLPLQKLGVQMIMNIYFAPVAKCIDTDRTGATYTVNNLQFHYSSLVPSPQWDNMYNEKVISQMPPSFSYVDYDCQEDTNTCLAGITSFSKVLTFKYSALTGVAVTFRLQSVVNDQAGLDKLSSFINPGISSAYLKVGSVQYPQDNTTNNGDRMSMAGEYFGVSLQDKPLAFAGNWESTTTNGTFVLAFPLQKHPYEVQDQRIFSDGVDTSIATSIVLNVTFSAALAANLVMEVVGRYQNTITYNPNGSITWNN